MAPTVQENSSLTDISDTLLADVAIRVQLSRTDYGKAVDRYQKISDWIERDGSPLKGRVLRFYAQGSMAIGATIASRLRTDKFDIDVGTDKFDIDVVAQLDLPANTSPEHVLNLLYQAIKGGRGSRYYEVTRRRTRCVTIQYADGMHVDVTPALRRPDTPERESWIFHHRPETPADPGYRLIANPYGFAEWFLGAIPNDQAFSAAIDARASAYHFSRSAMAMAESDPVPVQESLFQKSKAVIALQLLKRWRNLQYHARDGRQPPSIIIAKLVADAANHTSNLSAELLYQARHMRDVFQQRRARIFNPACERDILTDRWPASPRDQAVFIGDLKALVRDLERLVSGCDLGEMQSIMVRLFGEEPTKGVFAAFNRQLGRDVGDGRSRHGPDGRLAVPVGAGVSIATPSGSHATPKHTFYGGERR